MDPKATRPDYAYLDHPDFPVNAAEPGAPRMLKLLNPANPVEGESSGLQPRLGDFVVTILHHIAVSPTKYSSCFPTALDSFFDRTVAEYKLRGQYKPEDKKDPTNFIIWRKGDWVLCGLYKDKESHEYKWGSWKNMTHATISPVARNGRWETRIASAEAYSVEDDMEDVWERLINVNVGTSRQPLKSEEAIRVSDDFGRSFCEEGAWDPPGLWHLRLEITKNGKTSLWAWMDDQRLPASSSS